MSKEKLEYDKELQEQDIELEMALDEIEGEKVEFNEDGQLVYKSVYHKDRAAKFGVLSDGETSKYVNIALEYFDHRCALSGEKFEYIDAEEIDRKLTSNLSAEHVVPLCQGGHDIVPNLVPSVLQYNISKNGYYLLDWWKHQKDTEGKQIYSPYRLLKLTNFMIKSLQAREYSQGKTTAKKVEKYKEIILTDNEIDKFLKEIEAQDEIENSEKDNRERKIYSSVITATTLDENNKKVLTKIPEIEANIPSRSEQIRNQEQVDERVMMDIFLMDAVKVLEQQLPNETELHSKLNEKLASVVGEIPFEVKVRNIILEKLKDFGVEENIYTIANELLINTEMLNYAKQNKENEEVIIKYIEKYFKELNEIIKREFKILQVEEDKIIKIIENNPSVLYNEEQRKHLLNIIHLYSKYISSDVKVELLDKARLINALKAREWMEKNNVTRRPRGQWRNESGEKMVPDDEADIGDKLRYCIQEVVKPYRRLKTEEEKRVFKKIHPEIEELLIVIQWIEENTILQKEDSARYWNALRIKEWMEQNHTTRPPRVQVIDEFGNYIIPEDEGMLGNRLSDIRNCLIKPYKELKSKEEQDKYRKMHPEIDEVMQIVEWIDKNNVRQKEDSAYYWHAIEIKEWMIKNQTTKPPNSKSQNPEEKKLGGDLAEIRRNIIKPYLELKTEEEQEEYKNNHPEFEDVVAIIEWIDNNNVPIYLENARKIKLWMTTNKRTIPPRGHARNNDVTQEEKNLGNQLRSIRQNLIKPYRELEKKEKNETDEKRRKKYKIQKERIREQHPEIDEVMGIIDEIDTNNKSGNNKMGTATKEFVECIVILKKYDVDITNIKTTGTKIDELIKDNPNKEKILEELKINTKITGRTNIGGKLNAQKKVENIEKLQKEIECAIINGLKLSEYEIHKLMDLDFGRNISRSDEVIKFMKQIVFEQKKNRITWRKY